jgi:hypothetical protein
LATSKLPRLPKDSEIAFNLRDQHALNLLMVGETLMVRLVFPASDGIDAMELHQAILTEVAFPAYCTSTNNGTLTPSWLKSHEVLLVDGPVASGFLSTVAVNLMRSHLFLSLMDFLDSYIFHLGFHDGATVSSN